VYSYFLSPGKRPFKKECRDVLFFPGESNNDQSLPEVEELYIYGRSPHKKYILFSPLFSVYKSETENELQNPAGLMLKVQRRLQVTW